MDQARKILSMLVPFSEWCPPWEKAVNELALALAAAENRAAWDGWELGGDAAADFEFGTGKEEKRLEKKMKAEYGPREGK